MAKRTLTAMFDTYDGAAEAVRQLEAAGVPHADLAIVSNDASHQKHHRDATTADATGTGTGTGASLGTVIGGGAGLLAGLGMLAIPGLGPVVAAGWLASTLVGAGVGAAAGGVVGALTGAGVSETHARAYVEGVRRGGTLVTARVDDDMVDRATGILDRDGTVDMDEREAAWRGEGWTDTSTSGAVTGLGSAVVPPRGPIDRTENRADLGLRAAEDRSAEAVRRAQGQAGTRVGLQDATPADVAPIPADEPGMVYSGDRAGNRGRVRSYDQP